MGASSSTRRPHRSSPEEAVPNLVRSLEALLAWEDRAEQVKKATAGQVARPRGQGGHRHTAQHSQHRSRAVRPAVPRASWQPSANSSHSLSLSPCAVLCCLRPVGLDAVDLDGVLAVLAELDRIAGESGSAGGKRSKKERERAATPFTGTPFKSGSLFPAAGKTSTTAHMTGVAATAPAEEKQASCAVEVRRLTVLAGITTELQPASALFRKAAISSVAGRGDAGKAEEEGSGVEGEERKAAGLVEREAEEADEKVEVAAKHLFVHGWFQRLLRAAEHIVKLKSRLGALSSQLKPKRADELSEMEKLRLHRQHEQCSKALQSALLNWDKANVAAAWLERDFDLVYAELLAHSALHMLIHARDEIDATLAMQPSEELKKHLAVREPPAQMANQYVRDLELHAYRIGQVRQQHEFEALSVGLSYFDREGKGAITAAECPELSARLFSLLDSNKDGAISYDDLTRSVAALVSEMDRALEHIARLRRQMQEAREKSSTGPAADSISVQIAQNEAAIEEREREVQEKKKDLQAIFNYFHTAFAIHVFGLTGVGGRERRLRLPQLLSELERLEAEANRDPLQLDEAVLRSAQPPLAATAVQQSQLPTEPMHTAQPAPEANRAAQQQHELVDPAAARRLRWTESESDKEAEGGGAMSSITGKLKRCAGASGEERGAALTSSSVGSTAGPGAGKEATATTGEATSGVRSTLHTAGQKISEAASGMQEKVSETIGELQTKSCTH